MKILEAEGLNKHFGGLAATSPVDLDVRQGEILGLIGPNGAGKTTLFNLLSGALKPDSGTIRFKGTDLAGLKPHQISRMGIARTFQSVKIFSRMSVFNNVLLGHLFGRGHSTHLRRCQEGDRRDSGVCRVVGTAGFTGHGSDTGQPEETRGREGPGH